MNVPTPPIIRPERPLGFLNRPSLAIRSEEIAFNAALERPPVEREAFVANLCRGDLERRAAVLSLLAAHEAASGFMQDDRRRSPEIERKQPRLEYEAPGESIERIICASKEIAGN